KRREVAELRNQADTLVYQTEKFIADNPDTVPADVRSEVEQDIAALKKALETDDNDAVKTAFDKLSASRTKIGQAMYASAQQSQSDAGQDAAGDSTNDSTNDSTSGSAGSDDVVEGEIVDDDKPSNDPK
uniref:Hsp70 family protein n=1 Tax=Actinopolymorpha alba TaxID=533267 RepID=UPI0005905E29